TEEFSVKRGETTVVKVTLKPKPKLYPDPVPPPENKDPNPPIVTPQPDLAKLARVLARGRKGMRDGPEEGVGPAADEALKIDPQSPTALGLRAIFRFEHDEVENAREDAKEALKLNPETFEALVALGLVHARDGKLDEAIAFETAAIRLDPNWAVTWSNR